MSPYQNLLKPIFFQFDPEKVHNAMVWGGETLGRTALGRGLLDSLYGYHGPEIGKTVDGIHYRTPVLLSAGFDYNGRLTQALSALGFGGEEIGSITARPCAGNLQPRLTRLKKSQSILVNKGLRNDGAEAIIRRLQSRQRIKDFVVGVSIARTNDELSASDAAGIEDYYTSFKLVAESGVADYCTINISCPNAFGGETFAEPKRLARLLAKLRTVNFTKPLYIKMPINLAWTEFRQLLDIIVVHQVSGVIIGNLNKNYADLKFPSEAPAKFSGGLSGQPCFALSNNLIRQTRAAFGRQLTIIGCGGIFSPADALAKFVAGADLVQLITGMIFKGPSLIKEICRAYAGTI